MINDHLRRPRTLLFLGISYALWASVTLRWIMEFIEQDHPLTGLVSGMLILFGVLMGLQSVITGNSKIRAHLYLLFQMGLVVTAVLFYYQLDFFAILYLPLVGQATFLFPRRTATIWLAILIVATFLGQINQFGWPDGLPFIFLYTAGLIFVAAFSLLTLQSEASRQQSENLLLELQEAHRKLQAYAGQAEELAVVKERNRLARELHDSVAQTLYGLTLQAEAATRRLAAGQLDKVAGYLQEFRTQTRQTLQETRLLIYELRPPILEQVGLAAALRARLEAVEGRGGTHIETNLEEIGAAPKVVETGLYRIAQEALNNSLKHAQASQISLTLARKQASLFLQIQDDGVGFDPETVNDQGGFGLRGMRERVEQLKGSLDIQTGSGQGTTISVEVPI